MNNREERFRSLISEYLEAQRAYNEHHREIMEAEANMEYSIAMAQLDELTNGLWGLNE